MTRAQTARLKKAFLDEFARMGNISAACRAVGLERRRVYEWQEKDEAFAHAWRQAELESTERLEAEAYRRAHDGVIKETPIIHSGKVVSTIVEHKYSDTLLIFLLKARNPDKYGDRVRIDLRQQAAALAAELDCTVDELIAEAERIASGGR